MSRVIGAIGLSILAAILLIAAPASAQVPGGFVEFATSVDVRPLLTQTQIQALLPERGPFTFPPPYLTQGIRLTNANDCGGNDCVWYVGYSYYRNMNNHVGSDTMLIFLGLEKNRGGSGPTLFSYDKVTDVLTKVGPLFDPASPDSWATGEGWYFSATRPTALYLNDGPRLRRYDVVAKTFETVLDVSTQPGLFGTNRIIWQMHSSDDDRVHSATLKDGATYAELGCFAYREDTQQFFYFPQKGYYYDECQIDKNGKWLLIKEKLGTDPASEVDNRIIDLATGAETELLDRDGAGGHSDNGPGYMVAADNWNVMPNAVRLWKFGASPLVPGSVVYYDPQWLPQSVKHVSHANGKAGVSPEQQYACGSGADSTNGPRVNEVVCFMLDGSLRTLVVAPVMTDMNAPGGSDSYAKLPKGNVDVTGRYFIWTSNMGGSRLDAFIVKVPGQLLTSVDPAAADTTPPSVSLTAPTTGTTVTGTATVTATATDDVGVAGVQFKLDGVNLGAEVTTAPYSVSWNSTAVADGAHTLTAVARDAAGNTATSAPVSVTVANGTTSSPVSQSVTWTNLVNATAAGNSLQKTSGCDGCFDAGAISQQQIASGDGYAEFTATETTTLRVAGLTHAFTVTNPGTIDFGIRLQSGFAEVRENGVYRADTTVAPGDVFRIAVQSDVVRYSKNGAVFYTSTAAPTYPLFFAAALAHLNATVSDAMITAAAPDTTPPSVSLTAPTTGTTVTGTATVTATATDDVGVAGVQFKLDGVNLGAEVTTAPYSVSWNSTAVADGAHTLTAVARDAAGNTATSAPVSVTVANGTTDTGQSTTWTNLVHVTATGNSLQKTSGCDGCYDAGAISQWQLKSGNGYAEFTATETTTLRVAGLTDAFTVTSPGTIDFGIRFQSGFAEVRENGVYRAGTTFLAGDVFRIAVRSGIVRYYKNGSLLYKSAVKAKFPLFFAVALADLDATVTNVLMVGGF